jgi:hypothetical protein
MLRLVLLSTLLANGLAAVSPAELKQLAKLANVMTGDAGAEPLAAEATPKRSGKLFYVSTTSSTTTIATSTICFVTSAAITAACKRKRRSIQTGPENLDTDLFQPSGSFSTDAEVEVS